jgi:DNA mismatch repair ATPase MutL
VRELSLHILDIMQNSIAAGATKVQVVVRADIKLDSLVIRIEDNGKGMDAAMVAKVLDPFVTTRTTRRVGLGIPMFAEAAQACDGSLEIDSEPSKGTKVEARFRLSHIDRAPFGDIRSTMVTTIVANPGISFRYEQDVDGKTFSLDTDDMKEQLGDVPLDDPSVIRWMNNYMEQGLSGDMKIE